MKKHPVTFFCILLFSMMVLSASLFAQTVPQDTTTHKGTTIQDMVHSGDFVFTAQTALPMRGKARYLTSIYDLVVSKDTVKAFLPYFGRAYSAPIDPTKGGIQFTSTKFQYSITGHKRGRWNILIRPGDIRDIQQLVLSVSEGGYASLQVISNRRQPISFNGKISER